MNGFIIELPAELQAEVARHACQKPGGESAWVADAVRKNSRPELSWSISKRARHGAAGRLTSACWPRCRQSSPCQEMSDGRRAN